MPIKCLFCGQEDMNVLEVTVPVLRSPLLSRHERVLLGLDFYCKTKGFSPIVTARNSKLFFINRSSRILDKTVRLIDKSHLIP